MSKSLKFTERMRIYLRSDERKAILDDSTIAAVANISEVTDEHKDLKKFTVIRKSKKASRQLLSE